jgi:putative DNA primase/helicase
MPTDLVAGAAMEELDALAGLVLDPADPLATGRLFLQRLYLPQGIRGLHHQSGAFYEYRPSLNCYVQVDEASLRAGLYTFLEPAKRWTEPRGASPAKLEPFKPNKSKVENVLDAIRALCNLPSEKSSPCWLIPHDGNPLDIVSCRNGLLHLPKRLLLPATPQFFTLTSLNFDFSAAAPKPENWLRFLLQLWPDDPQSVETLQEWIGYLLTPRTHFQKILMLVGPKRSGKGTIGRVIRMLLGDRNVCESWRRFILRTRLGKFWSASGFPPARRL